MTESITEQPGLPLFPGRNVQYNIVQPHGPNGEYPERGWVPVVMPVDEIDDVADPQLRDALWRQFHEEERETNWAQFIFVRPDGSYSHAFRVPTKPLGVRFTSQGIELPDALDMPLPFPHEEEATPLPPSSRVQKILSWLRK